MFTPQRAGSSVGPSSGKPEGSSTCSGAVKAKTVEAIPPPPLTSLEENGRGTTAQVYSGGEIEVWQRFRHAGLLDEASLERKDKEAMTQRIQKLEGELYDYQYNMGLLLIEKKEWTSQFEELQKALLETREIAKREQSAHLIAISEVEKREENFRKALEVEKQCVADLEKAFHELRSESAGVKVTSDEKLAEAHALVSSVEHKSLEAESKLHTAEARLAEISRKTSEIERKLREVEHRESVVQKEQLSFKSEKEAHDSLLLKQREELQRWEEKLQEGQRKLLDNQRLLNQKEARANEKEKLLLQKEKDLEETQRNVELAASTVRNEEASISTRSAALAVKENEADLKMKNLKTKEEVLHVTEEKLTAREKVELQKLTDDHKAALQGQKEEFELEMNRKRASLEEEMRNKAGEIDKKCAELDLKEAKLVKKEQALAKKSEKLTEKDKEHELKLKALKEQEKSLKAEEKSFQVEKKQLESEKYELCDIRSKLSKDRIAGEELERQILKRQQDLKLTEDERRAHSDLQEELRCSIEDCRRQKEVLLKDMEDMKLDREKIERDWDALDEKKVKIDEEERNLKEEKETFLKWRDDEKERLRHEKVALEEKYRRELEALQLERESFAAAMKQEKLELHERARAEREDMFHNLSKQRQTLESSIRQHQDEVERQLSQKQRLFEEDREREMRHVGFLREKAQSELEDIKLEKERIERIRQGFASEREHLERERQEIQKDIQELHHLHEEVKNQRETFIRERNHFLAFVEKNGTCRNCGEMAFSALQPLVEIEDAGATPLLRLAEDCINVTKGTLSMPSLSPSGMHLGSGASSMSWLRKCARYLTNITPSKKRSDDTVDIDEDSLSHAPHSETDMLENFYEAKDPSPSAAPTISDGNFFGRDTDNVEHVMALPQGLQDQPSAAPGRPVFEVMLETYSRKSGVDAQAVSDDNCIGREADERNIVAQKITESPFSVPENTKSGEVAEQQGRVYSRIARRLQSSPSADEILKESNGLLEKSGKLMSAEGNRSSRGRHQNDLDGGALAEASKHTGRRKRRRWSNAAKNIEDSKTPPDAIKPRRRRRTQEIYTGDSLGAKRYNLRSTGTESKPAREQGALAGEDDNAQQSEPASGEEVTADEEPETESAEPVSHQPDVSPSRINVVERAVGSIEIQKLEERAFEVTHGTDCIGVSDAHDEDEVIETYSTDESDHEEAKDEEDDSENNNTSVGKKLWKFFTS